MQKAHLHRYNEKFKLFISVRLVNVHRARSYKRNKLFLFKGEAVRDAKIVEMRSGEVSAPLVHAIFRSGIGWPVSSAKIDRRDSTANDRGVR